MPVKALPVFLKKITYVYRQLFNNKITEKNTHNFFQSSVTASETKKLTIMKEVSKGSFPKITNQNCHRGQFFLLLIFLQFFSLHVFAQQTVTGSVKDESGNALPGVTVSLKGQIVTAKTDVDGTYSIKVPALKSVLVFTSIGFGNKEVDRKSVV